MGAGTILVILAFLLMLLAWEVVLSFNKDLVWARAWAELARRSLPFMVLVLMTLSLPLGQGLGDGPVPLVWALLLSGVAMIISRFLSEPAEEHRVKRDFSKGDYKDTAALYSVVSEREPLARYRAFLGATQAADERYEEPTNASTEGVGLDPGYGLAYYNRALVLHQKGGKSRVAKDLRKGLWADLPGRFRITVREM